MTTRKLPISELIRISYFFVTSFKDPKLSGA